MPIYRFRILDKFDRVIAGQHSHCEDDDAARRHAEILAAHTRHSSIEIWHDQRWVPAERSAPAGVDAPRSKAIENSADSLPS